MWSPLAGVAQQTGSLKSMRMSHSRVHVATWPHQCTLTFNPCKSSSKSRARPSALRKLYSLSPSLSLLLLALKRGVESRLDYSHINMFAFHRFSGRPTRHVRDSLYRHERASRLGPFSDVLKDKHHFKYAQIPSQGIWEIKFSNRYYIDFVI